MPICAPEKSACVIEAIIEVEESAFDMEYSTNTRCDCLPACTEMEFPHETSVSRLHKASLINVPLEKKGGEAIVRRCKNLLTVVLLACTLETHPEYNNDSYVENNLSLMHIYFKNMHFIRQQRGEFYGFVDFFSNVGGLIGLCLGVSAISVVEVLVSTYNLLVRTMLV